MPIYNGYPQVYYPQQPQGQLEQLRAAQYQAQPVMMPTMQGQAMARLFVTRKAGDIRQLKAAADAPGGELAAELLQKMQQPPDHE